MIAIGNYWRFLSICWHNLIYFLKIHFCFLFVFNFILFLNFTKLY